jgi:hypothetical protein
VLAGAEVLQAAPSAARVHTHALFRMERRCFLSGSGTAALAVRRSFHAGIRPSAREDAKTGHRMDRNHQKVADKLIDAIRRDRCPATAGVDVMEIEGREV